MLEISAVTVMSAKPRIYMAGPIVGYRGDFRLSADNEGSTVNLQVEFFIRESGGTIVDCYEDLAGSLGPLRGSAS